METSLDIHLLGAGLEIRFREAIVSASIRVFSSTAARFSVICSAFVAPKRTVATIGLRRAKAMAMAAFPPELVGEDHLIALPSRGPEELTKHDLGVTRLDRRSPGLVVISSVVEKVDPHLSCLSHDGSTGVARDSFIGPPGSH